MPAGRGFGDGWNFRQALAVGTPHQIPLRLPNFWKIFLVVLLFGFSLVALPSQGAAEQSLTSANLLELVNQDRVQNGAEALQRNAALAGAAEAKARHILENGYFAHTSPDGVRPWDFIKAAGFAYNYAGENLALNYTNSYELEKDFLQSPDHRDNLLSPLYTQTGIAVVYGLYRGEPAVVTVQMFAAPAGGDVALK